MVAYDGRREAHHFPILRPETLASPQPQPRVHDHTHPFGQTNPPPHRLRILPAMLDSVIIAEAAPKPHVHPRVPRCLGEVSGIPIIVSADADPAPDAGKPVF